MKNFMTASPKRLRRQRRQQLRNPWTALAEMRDEMENWFEDSNMTDELSEFDFSPTCNLKENNNEYIVKFDIPGVKKEDVTIEVENNRLTVQGERKEQKEEKDAKHHLTESYEGSFMRSFTLPSKVNENNVDARYLDGVLTIKIPKMEPSKTKKNDIH